MSFEVLIDPLAVQDIQDAINYYEEKSAGLGKKFENELNEQILFLAKNPFLRTRYENVRCLVLNVFPFMIHFTIDEDLKTITIRAVFHTSINPQKWNTRN
jgi:plasmid stabilization system protein ParE